jgi:basic membrane protein A and related proteins
VKKRSTAALALCACIAALALAAVGGLGSSAQARPQATPKVGVVTDIGGLNDKGFNHLAYVGMLRAQSKLGVKTRVYITKSASDRLPNLTAAARDGNGLVFATGFLMFDSVGKVAKSFPKTKFAGIDISVKDVPEGKLPNFRGIQFKEQQAGYLVGYIAGLEIKRHPYKGKQMVSAVGANKVPAIVRYMAGYRAGAKKADPKVAVRLDYANDPTFSDQAKCHETTLNQIQAGSGVVFEVAGGCGLGGLSAAKQNHVWGIGVDADQGYLGSHILTSALKRVDVAVFDTIKAFKANPAKFKAEYDATFDVKNGGVGYGKLSSKLSKADRTYITKKVNAIEKQIASGKIVPPAQ